MSALRITIGAIIAALLLAGCAQRVGPLIKGSGPVIREERPASGVRAVEFGAFGSLEIVQGDEEGLTLLGQGNILPHIISEVDGDTMRISVDGSVDPTYGLQMRLRVRELRSIVAGGAGGISASGISGDSLSISVVGANTVTVAGVVREQTVTLSGAGSYDGSALASQRATVTIDGFADAVVRVEEQLLANISGNGSVEYFGEPRVIDNITGLGQVMRRTVP
ncbi:hypothetical protein EKD04_007165 [Chloroflexales bacterium ZM16-3]|nr:hypothetical protein [Chloroflexales bacterium ZM16-3]